MANCLYCGQPAGFLRSQHAECEKRHQNAVSSVPVFFNKVMDNPISAERFSELLQAAAKASFLRQDELKTLCLSGINGIVDSILQKRVVTPSELRRLVEITDSLGAGFSGGLGIDEKLIKLGVLSDLYDGKLSENVVIVGPMPIKLGQGEAFLWIFNDVRSFRTSVKTMKAELPINLANPADAHYFSPQMIKEAQVRTEKLSEETKGDLVLTNRNIYFLQSETSQIRVPISRITSLKPYAAGLQVGWKPREPQSRAFLLDDSWFAANVIMRLIQLVRR
jgi:hypothetical protein